MRMTVPPRSRKVCKAAQASGKALRPLCTTPQISERITSTPSTRSRSRSTKRNVMICQTCLARTGDAARQRGGAAGSRRRIDRGGFGRAGTDRSRTNGSSSGAASLLHSARGAAIGGGGALGPQRSRRREQKTLAEADVVIEQIDHRALALDLLGDQVDAEAAEQVGKIGWMNVGGRLLGIEQQRGRHLDEAHAAVGKLARFEAQIGDMVDRETIVALRKRREMLGLGGPEIA